MYPDWYKNFFSGFFKNKGGMIDERPGYYNGGPTGAPMGGTWSDVPMGEGGPTQDPEIMRLPMGQEGSFEDENEGILGLELAGLSDDERTELQSLMSLRLVTPKDDPKYEQIEIRIQELMGRMGQETAMSEPHPDEGAYDMFFDEFGRYPKDSEELRLFLDEIDLDVPAVARGGLMSRPGYADAGVVIDEEEKNPFEMKLFGKKFLGLRGLLYKYGLLDPTSELNERLTRGGREAADEMFGYMDKAQGGRVGMYGGGISDMDLTNGGVSFGPGTGTSDEIPAMLSDGEFVVTANAVKNLGGGNRMVGAKKMYQMMNQLDPNSQTPAEMDTTGIA